MPTLNPMTNSINYYLITAPVSFSFPSLISSCFHPPYHCTFPSFVSWSTSFHPSGLPFSFSSFLHLFPNPSPLLSTSPLPCIPSPFHPLPPPSSSSPSHSHFPYFQSLQINSKFKLSPPHLPTNLSAALSFSFPLVTTPMLQSTQRANPSFSSSSAMLPACQTQNQTMENVKTKNVNTKIREWDN